MGTSLWMEVEGEGGGAHARAVPIPMSSAQPPGTERVRICNSCGTRGMVEERL